MLWPDSATYSFAFRKLFSCPQMRRAQVKASGLAGGKGVLIPANKEVTRQPPLQYKGVLEYFLSRYGIR